MGVRKIKISYIVGIILCLFLSIPAFAATVQYTYDSLNRLTRVDYGAGAIIAYSYDSNGNRLTKTETSADIVPPFTTANPSGNTFIDNFSVSLTADETATIYYTIDGSLPDTDSAQYIALIQIFNTTTLKFFAVDITGNIENVKTENYTINPAPTIIDGLPSDVSNASDFTVAIAGNGLVSYKYKLDDNETWSEERDIATPIELSNLFEGEHNLYVIGKDSINNWQTEANATTASWTINTVAIGDINDDGNIDLTDAILALQVVSGIDSSQNIYRAADANGDGKIGIQEVTYILQKVSGARQ